MSTDTHKPDGWSVLSNVAQNAEWRRFKSDNLRDLASARLSAQREFLEREFGKPTADHARDALFRAARRAVSFLTLEEAEKLARDVAFHMTYLAKEQAK